MIVSLIVQIFIWFGAMGALLFLAAGTFAWPGAIPGCFRSEWAPRYSAISRPPTRCC